MNKAVLFDYDPDNNRETRSSHCVDLLTRSFVSKRLSALIFLCFVSFYQEKELEHSGNQPKLNERPSFKKKVGKI